MNLVLSPDMSKCFQVLSKLKKHPKADPFLFPVDTNIITDYLIYVKGIIKIMQSLLTFLRLKKISQNSAIYQ